MPGRRSPIYCVIGLTILFAVPAASGQRPRPGAPSPLPILPAEEAWSLTLPDVPAAGGAIDRDRVYVPLRNGDLLAVSRTSGSLMWQQRLTAAAYPPIVDGGSIVVVSTDGVTSVQASTGRVRWRFATAAVPASNAAAGGGRLLLVVAGELLAIDSPTGKLVWRSALPGEFDAAFVTVSEGSVFVSGGAVILCADLGDGRPRWSRSLPAPLGPVTVASGRLFTGSADKHLYALAVGDGRVLWRKAAGGRVLGAAADAASVFMASLDNVLTGLQLGNGNQRWRHELSRRPMTVPAAFGGVVLNVAVARDISAHDARTGAQLASYTAAGDLEGPPLADGHISAFGVSMVVLTRDGQVTGLRSVASMFHELPAVPWSELPGRPLSPEPRDASTGVTFQRERRQAPLPAVPLLR